MKIRKSIRMGGASARGTGLVELMVSVGIGSLVLASAVTMFISGQANFTGLGNYADLSNESRLALDRMSRDLREATQVTGWQTNAAGAILTVTNSLKGVQTSYTWDASTGVIYCSQTGQADKAYLTGCDFWTCSFYQRTPNNNWTFYPANNLSACKLINMSWKCSRSVAGRRRNTENMVTAQVVLRNKP